MTDWTVYEQTSTRVLAPEFEYLEPKSREEALLLLAGHQNIRVLAGGTDLLVKMKLGAVAPQYLLSIRDVADLKYIQADEGLRIGAATPLTVAAESPAIRRGYSALFEALKAMAGPAIRAMGTIGGNLCNASPAADTPPALVALGAEVAAERVGGCRTIPLDEFFVGPGKTVLQPDELLTEIRVPQTAPASGSAYVKIGRVSGDIAKVNAAVALEREGGVCTGCRIALGSVGPTVVRGRGAESRLLGETVSLSLIRAAARQAAEEIRPITDLRSTATYRKTVTAVMLEELLITAWGRAGGGLPK